MRLTINGRSTLAAAGMFVITGILAAQTSPPAQNGSYPNGSTQTSPGYAGQTPRTPAGNAGAINPDGVPGGASDKSNGPGPGERAMDLRFARDAAVGGMTEVELGKLAVSKGSSDKVKQFGQKMIDDHTKAGEELKAVAARNKMTLPSELDAKHKAIVEKFSAMSGDQFDKAYVTAMVKDHDKDVADFKTESETGTNADLKSFATKTLPTLQEHDRMIKEIKSGLMSKM